MIKLIGMHAKSNISLPLKLVRLKFFKKQLKKLCLDFRNGTIMRLRARIFESHE